MKVLFGAAMWVSGCWFGFSLRQLLLERRGRHRSKA